MQVYNPNDPQFHIKDEQMQVDASGINFEMTNDFESGVNTVVGQRVMPQSVYDREEKSPFQEMGLQYYGYCLLFLVMFIAGLIGTRKEFENKQDGTLVTAQVTEIEYGIRRGRETVYGVFTDDTGVQRTVKLINVGDEMKPGYLVEGYYNPKYLGEVWCEPSLGARIFMIIWIGFSGLAGIGGLLAPPIYAIVTWCKSRR